MSSAPPRPTEDDLIARHFAPLAGAGGLALRDDAALLSPSPGHDLVLTADAVVAGVHFFPDDLPDAIAWKALAVNASDLAAKGARPSGYLLTLALPDDWQEPWLERFCAGLGEAADRFACPLLGGDTVRANGPLLVGVTALGEVPNGAMVRRTSARAGDRLCVTGTIGDAALGLALRRDPGAGWAGSLTDAMRGHLAGRYLRPQPRLALAPALRRHARAAMDVSDGLAGDLAKMMRGSGVTAAVDAALVPLSPAARAALAAEPGLIDRIVTGGDDYEILCAVPPSALTAFLAEAGEARVSVTPIGTVLDGEGVPTFRDRGAERRYQQGSFSHF